MGWNGLSVFYCYYTLIALFLMYGNPYRISEVQKAFKKWFTVAILQYASIADWGFEPPGLLTLSLIDYPSPHSDPASILFDLSRSRLIKNQIRFEQMQKNKNKVGLLKTTTPNMPLQTHEGSSASWKLRVCGGNKMEALPYIWVAYWDGTYP